MLEDQVWSILRSTDIVVVLFQHDDRVVLDPGCYPRLKSLRIDMQHVGMGPLEGGSSFPSLEVLHLEELRL